MAPSRVARSLRAATVAALIFGGGTPAGAQTRSTPDYLCNDSHFHLTNYVQEGPTIQQFLAIMGDKVGRVALFGIPLQQQWSFGIEVIGRRDVTGDGPAMSAAFRR